MKTNSAQSPSREMQIWELHLQFQTQGQIAQALGITQSAVSQALARIRKRLATTYAREAASLRLEITEHLWNIACEAMHAWQQSQQEQSPCLCGKSEGKAMPEATEGSCAGQDVARFDRCKEAEEAPTAPDVRAWEEAPVCADPKSERVCPSGGCCCRARDGKRSGRKAGGNVVYLRIAREVFADIRALWGVDLPPKAEGVEAPQEWPKMVIGVDIDEI